MALDQDQTAMEMYGPCLLRQTEFAELDKSGATGSAFDGLLLRMRNLSTTGTL